jgi:hypothetical protein
VTASMLNSGATFKSHQVRHVGKVSLGVNVR